MLDKARIAGIAATAVTGVIIGALIGVSFGHLGRQGDLDGKMTETAIGILQAKPTKETAPLREWAVDVIDRRAKFSFNEAQRAVLLKTELPPIAVSQTTTTMRALPGR